MRLESTLFQIPVQTTLPPTHRAYFFGQLARARKLLQKHFPKDFPAEKSAATYPKLIAESRAGEFQLAHQQLMVEALLTPAVF